MPWGGTVASAVGDKVITDTTSTGMGYLEAQFRQLHSAFAAQRAAWTAHQLEQHLFGSLPTELSASARIADSPEFRQVAALVRELRSLLL